MKESGHLPPQYDLPAKWDACTDIAIRRVAYSSLIGAFGGLLFLIKLCATSTRDGWQISVEFNEHETDNFAVYSEYYTEGSPVSRWASVAFGAGVGIGMAYTECSHIFNGSPRILVPLATPGGSTPESSLAEQDLHD